MCDERNIVRKSSASNPNLSIADVRDILLFGLSIPDFVAQSYISLNIEVDLKCGLHIDLKP